MDKEVGGAGRLLGGRGWKIRNSNSNNVVREDIKLVYFIHTCVFVKFNIFEKKKLNRLFSVLSYHRNQDLVFFFSLELLLI